MASYASVLQDGMSFLTGIDIAEPITIQIVSKDVDTYGDCTTTVTSSTIVNAVISRYTEEESQVSSGLGKTNRPPGQYLGCQFVAYCSSTDVSTITHEQAMRGRIVYAGNTYEIIDEDEALIGNTSVYRAFYLKRM